LQTFRNNSPVRNNKSNQDSFNYFWLGVFFSFFQVIDFIFASSDEF